MNGAVSRHIACHRGWRGSGRNRLLWLFAVVLPAIAQGAESQVLARIDLIRPVRDLAAPVYSMLEDANGQAYALAFATKEALDGAGWPYQVLDSGGQLGDYVMAVWRRSTAPRPDPGLPVLCDNGRSLLLRATGPEAEKLAELGFELRRLPAQPVIFAGAARSLHVEAFAYSALVNDVIQQVRTTNLQMYVSQLTGTNRAVTGGDFYQIVSRHTSKWVPTQKANQYAFQHFQALGLNVSYQAWKAGGYSNRNVVAILPGGALSNEVVLITAHLDDMPSGATAPGADDNASGCAGVLMAADVLAKCRFDRTIHFVLFTGEEQGLYGSDAYAAALSGAGVDVEGMLNLDMIGWDSNNNGAITLYVRESSWPGYLNDRAIVAVLTNVVATYGMAGHVVPSVEGDPEGYSDHYSFWDHGYAALSAIDDDNGTENPNYHTTSDTLATLNLTYLTWVTKAAVGTVAHMAGPTHKVPFDLIQVDNGDWVGGSGVGVGTLYAKHEQGATETGADGRDGAWTNAPVNPNAQWLRIHTQPYAPLLQTDARPTNSGSVFYGTLSVVKTNSGSFSCTNRLRFTYLADPESNRIYTVKVHVHGAYAHNGSEFDCVTNLRQVVAGSGYINLPGLVGLTNGTIYGTCDIGSRPIVTDPTNFPLRIAAVTGNLVNLTVPAQVGSRIVDTVEASTNLIAAGNAWRIVKTSTNYVAPDAANFDGGRQELAPQVNSPFTNAPTVCLRFRRLWLPL